MNDTPTSCDPYGNLNLFSVLFISLGGDFISEASSYRVKIKNRTKG